MKHIVFCYAGAPDNQSSNSPYTITRELHRALTKVADRIDYLDWCHTGPLPPVGQDTILLLHPNYPTNTPAWRLFQERVKLKCLIFPLHHALPAINLPFDALVRQADHVFSITGEYWYDTLPQSAFAHWQPKITRVDMAIDTNDFPFLRNGIAGRDFAYIGCDRPEKRLRLLYDIFKLVPYKLHVYGNIDGSNPLLKLRNVVCHGYTGTTSDFGRDLCAQCVAFLNPSISDACPTTLLEASAWGLLVACTVGSGYHHGRDQDAFLNLNEDPIIAKRLLEWIVNEPADNLLARIYKARQIIEAKHNWNRFTSTVINKLLELSNGQ